MLDVPLTEERERLFRGRGPGGRGWFVVDPAHEPSALIAEWRRNFSTHNEPAARRLARWVVGIVTYLAIWALLGLGLWAVHEVALLFYPGLVVAAVLGLVGLLAAVILADHVVPTTQHGRPRVSGIVAVDPRVVRWATNATPIDDVWDLALALDRVEQVLSAEQSWAGGWDWDHGMRPDELIEDVISPVLEAQKSRESQQLLRVAHRVGFKLPQRLQRELRAVFEDGDPSAA
jgi:hypothetical protein